MAALTSPLLLGHVTAISMIGKSRRSIGTFVEREDLRVSATRSSTAVIARALPAPPCPGAVAPVPFPAASRLPVHLDPRAPVGLRARDVVRPACPDIIMNRPKNRDAQTVVPEIIRGKSCRSSPMPASSSPVPDAIS
ncbi:hypothetical protein [Sphingomonas sp. Leaf22]|uniref:hypothetical protein n=1 Tax=Sphingomonas sp. Leaf22 TaxID=1735687 RepID=UPI00138F9795|nr:hypothetical protein [Sphingomonas sp. Leaf22]